MDAKITYSVIIPVYNSEKTIARCLESLLSQKRSDVELIVVNDGSADQSDSIIRDFEGKFSAINYIIKENGGVSSARNTGLENASGEYILFVDSDDFVAGNYFKRLDQMNAKADSDLILFNHRTSDSASAKESERYRKLSRLTDRKDILENILAGREINAPWNKRFKRTLIEKYRIRFDENLYIGEDMVFCLSYALNCQSIKVYDQSLYILDTTDFSSLSRKYRSDLVQQLTAVGRLSAKRVRESRKTGKEKEKLLAIVDFLYVKNALSCLAEECKEKKPNYFSDRKRTISICRKFSKRLSHTYYNEVHKILREFLHYKCYFLLYTAAVELKGRKFIKNADTDKGKLKNTASGDKIRVLIVAGDMDVGGIENQLMHLLRNADPELFQIDFTSTMEHSFYKDEIEQLGGGYIRIQDMNWRMPWVYCRTMFRIMKEGQYDVVHSHELFHSGITLWLAAKAGVKSRIAHAHNWSDDDGTGKKRSLAREVYNRIMRRMILCYSTEQVACSSLAGEFLYGKETTKKNSYHLVYNSVDTSKFIEKYDLTESGEFCEDGWKNIIHVGRVTPVKNQLFIADIASELKKRGDKIRILSAGNGDPDYERQVKQKIRSEHLENYFLMLGVRNDIDTLMRKSSAFILPSKYEGMPLVLIEAQASGLPCVVADTFSHEVDYELGTVQWLELEDGAAKWADAVETAAEMQKAGKEEVIRAINENGFDSKIFAQTICDIYKKSVNR